MSITHMLQIRISGPIVFSNVHTECIRVFGFMCMCVLHHCHFSYSVEYCRQLGFPLIIIIITVIIMGWIHCNELGRNKLSSPIQIIRCVQFSSHMDKFFHRVNMFVLPFAAIDAQ